MQTLEKYIFDTSVLIAFSNLNKIDLLCKLYKKIIIPETVKDEFDEKLPWCYELIKVDNLLVEFLQIEASIGKGEAEVITYCLNQGDNITCFIDDQKARKIAKSLHLKVSGTIGILMKLEERKLISSAYEDIIFLKEKGFYISDEIVNSFLK